MKTIDLKAAYAKATPIPLATNSGFIVGTFRSDGTVHDVADPRCAPPDADAIVEMNYNEALLVHAFNVLPEVVEALHSLCVENQVCYCEGIGTCRYCIARTILTKANTLQIP